MSAQNNECGRNARGILGTATISFSLCANLCASIQFTCYVRVGTIDAHLPDSVHQVQGPSAGVPSRLNGVIVC